MTIPAAKKQTRALLRRMGWELHRFDPQRSLPNYLTSMLFPYFGINCVVDVGAHFGEYGTLLRDGGYRGLIVSFEPVEASFRQLQEASAADPNWITYRCALGESTGSMTMNVSLGSDASSFLQVNDFGLSAFPLASVGSQEQVDIRRLDDLWPAIAARIGTPRVYLKLDTQGWDLEVVKGGPRFLESVLALQSEMSVQPIYEGAVDFREAMAAFNAAGFVLSGMFPVSHDDALRMIEFDCVMVRNSESPQS